MADSIETLIAELEQRLAELDTERTLITNALKALRKK